MQHLFFLFNPLKRTVHVSKFSFMLLPPYNRHIPLLLPILVLTLILTRFDLSFFKLFAVVVETFQFFPGKQFTSPDSSLAASSFLHPVAKY